MAILREIGEIVSGQRTSTRQVGDDITAEDLWDTYVHVPGAAAIIDRPIEAMFHNGFRDWDLDYERKLEIEKAMKFRDLFGISAILMNKDGDIQAWNLKADNVGFTLAAFDDLGRCTSVKIYADGLQGKEIKGRDIKFFLFRTPDGLPGERGLSKLLNLIDVVRINHEIWTEYLKYAKHQGLAHPVMKVKDLDDDKYLKVESELNAPTKDDAVIIDIEDDFDYKSPQKEAYNPVPMLEYGDTYITRESSLSKIQIYGEYTGALAASDTQTGNWYAHIKELQDEIMPSLTPLLKAMGAPDDVQFNEPGEYQIGTQMNGVLQIRMALEGLVPPEQIVDVINRYLAFAKKDKLRAMTPEEREKLDPKMTFPQNPRGENSDQRQERQPL